MSDLIIVITAEGELKFVWDDALYPLLDAGRGDIKRASHVEPVFQVFCRLEWAADLSPVGGPLLGPFPSRAAALAGEIEVINELLIAGAI